MTPNLVSFERVMDLRKALNKLLGHKAGMYLHKLHSIHKVPHAILHMPSTLQRREANLPKELQGAQAVSGPIFQILS